MSHYSMTLLSTALHYLPQKRLHRVPPWLPQSPILANHTLAAQPFASRSSPLTILCCKTFCPTAVSVVIQLFQSSGVGVGILLKLHTFILFPPASSNCRCHGLFTIVVYAISPHPQKMFYPAYPTISHATAAYAVSINLASAASTIAAAQSSEADISTEAISVATSVALVYPTCFFQTADDTPKLALYQTLCLAQRPPQESALYLL